LRTRLASAARKTIAERFDWKVVMPRYADLWREQIERLMLARAQGSARSLTWQTHDPALTFAGFASHHLRGESLLARGENFGRWNDLIQQPGIVVNASALTGRKQFQTLHKLFSDPHSRTIDDVLKSFEANEAKAMRQTLHWLIKVGLLRLAEKA
jgi:hypothetical protein